jgi:CRISPR-associated protein Csd1
MILQELARFYDRKLEEGEMPREGFLKQEIKFKIVVDLEGNLQKVISLQKERIKVEGKKEKKEKYYDLVDSPLIPSKQGKAAFEKVSFIVENPKFVFGNLDRIKAPEYANSYRKLLQRCFQETGDLGIEALLKFLDKVDSLEIATENFNEIFSLVSALIAFELEGDYKYLWERPKLLFWYIKDFEERTLHSQLIYGQCLISGLSNVPIARIHENAKLNAGAVSDKNAALVSFNESAYCSLGKTQSLNSPISVSSERAYGNALKFLYNKESKQKLKVGDTVLSFWTEEKSDFEKVIKDTFDPQEESFEFEDSEKIDPEEEIKQDKISQKLEESEDINKSKKPFEAVKKGLENIRKLLGIYKSDSPENKKRFFVLGLSPNSARLAVRLWYQGSIYETAKRVSDYFDDLEIVKDTKEEKDLALWKLLSATAFESKSSNIHPKLAGDMFRAIFQGTEYPRILLQSIVNRIKAERKIDYYKAALLKAFLTRWRRREGIANYPEIKPNMDESNTNIAYRLGRLFATLEKLQEEAHENKLNATIRDRFYGAASSNPSSTFPTHENKLNATIRDRFYGAASSNPSSTFPTLIKLSNHHLEKYSKIQKDYKKRNFDSLIGEIIDGIDPSTGFPNTFTLEEQGLFAIGYYQQKQAFYTKKEVNTNPDNSQGEE